MVGITMALLLTVGSEAPVRIEADGIRVGAELVSGPALLIKGESAPLLVSGSVVESLGAPVTVALDATRTLTLDAGVRLTRTAAGFALGTHGPSLLLHVAGRTIAADSALSFSLTDKGYDLGALGAFEAATLKVGLAAPAAAPAVAADTRRQDPVSPARRRRTQINSNRRFVYVGDPTVAGAAASFFVLSELSRLSPDGSN